MLVFPILAIAVWALFYSDIFNWKEMLRTPEERAAMEQRALLWYKHVHPDGSTSMRCVAHDVGACNVCPQP